MEVICNKELLVLLTERAIFWPSRQVLILADMHLGKSGYFRSNGIQIPSTIMLDDLKRLSYLIERYRPKEVLVTGDMFHHNYNADINLFKKWRQNYLDVDFILVPGNHDKLLKIDYEELNIQLRPSQFSVPPFIFLHEAAVHKQQVFTISGHLHPGYIIEGRAKQSLRMPCFIVSEQHIILPAFSRFTGLYTGYEKSPNHNYYLIADNKIFKV